MPFGSKKGSKRSTSKRFSSKKRSIKYKSKKPSRLFSRKVLEKAAEKKYIITEITNLALDQTATANATIFSLTTVPAGQTDTSRIGDQVTIRSLEFNYSINQELPGTSHLFAYCRIILFQWFENDAYDTVTLDKILATVPSPAYRYLAPYAHDFRYQFRILYDKTHIMVNTSAATGFTNNSYTPSVHVMLTQFPKNRIQYVAASSTGVNNIYCLALGTAAQGDATNTKPKFQFECKFNFSDA